MEGQNACFLSAPEAWGSCVVRCFVLNVYFGMGRQGQGSQKSCLLTPGLRGPPGPVSSGHSVCPALGNGLFPPHRATPGLSSSRPAADLGPLLEVARGLVCWPGGPESPGNVCGLRKECSQLAGGRRRHESEVILPAEMVLLYICGDVGVPRCLQYPPWHLRGQWGGGEGSRLRSSRTGP